MLALSLHDHQFIGAPERIRTSDLCLRRATLYPAELRALREKRKCTRFVGITNEILTEST
jgi:hypothetical protein